MDMPIRLVEIKPRACADMGKVAVMREPLVYCLEEADNDMLLQNLSLNEKFKLSAHFEKDLLNGITVISAMGSRTSQKGREEDLLYRSYRGKQQEDTGRIYYEYF